MTTGEMIHKALTIELLRVIEFARSYDCDADMIQEQFIGEITDYERNLAEAEGINLKE